MKYKLRYSALFIGAILLLQLGMHAVLRFERSAARFGEVVKEKELEPAVFFYTDSPQALSSEKIVRKNVSQLNEVTP